MSLLGYLFRVVLYLIALGGVAAIVLWGLEVVSAIRSGFAAERGRRERDR